MCPVSPLSWHILFPLSGVLLSLYLVNFHVFFEVPTQISFLQEDSPTPKAAFRCPPFVLSLPYTFLIWAFITLCGQCPWLAYLLGWIVSSLRVEHMSVTHKWMYTSPDLTFRNFIILKSGPSNTLASQLLEFSSCDLAFQPTLTTDPFTHQSPHQHQHQELQPSMISNVCIPLSN